ncbi:MAG: oxygen-independent coproporphyrinogen III oxidase [Clostridia bacterium]|nr:oxygen-independent coproporphyrinogen III oxidase [Clostridia bacterium]
MKEVGIYIHIPFCKSKCYYCDFVSYSDKSELIEDYIKWLNVEIKEVGKGIKQDFENGINDMVKVKTIYIGGGTPSYIESSHIVEVIETIKKNYIIDEKAEITIEVNPGTVTKEKLLDYKKTGINRLSIGLQETNNCNLKTIGRIHTYEDFLSTYNLAKEVGFENINADLMLGLPNQTIEDLKKSLEKLLKLDLKHISIYSLILEENTKLERLVNEGKLKLTDEEIERKMYWFVKNKLEEAGFIHYEISNFSKVGYESKHNLDCWEQKEYMGFGVASHSYTDDTRFSNIDDIEVYIKNFKNGQDIDNLIFHEKQTKQSKMKEYMLLGLRKIDGVSIQNFKNKFLENPIYLYKDEINKLVKDDLLEVDGDNIKLTKKGIDLANLVWQEFV